MTKFIKQYKQFFIPALLIINKILYNNIILILHEIIKIIELNFIQIIK